MNYEISNSKILGNMYWGTSCTGYSTAWFPTSHCCLQELPEPSTGTPAEETQPVPSAAIREETLKITFKSSFCQDCDVMLSAALWFYAKISQNLRLKKRIMTLFTFEPHDAIIHPLQEHLIYNEWGWDRLWSCGVDLRTIILKETEGRINTAKLLHN